MEKHSGSFILKYMSAKQLLARILGNAYHKMSEFEHNLAHTV